MRHDWRALHKLQTITGDGVTKAFNLASDYARLSKMPAVSRSGSTSGFWPSGPASPPAFIGASTLAIQSVRPTFQIEAGVMTFDQAPGTSDVYVVSYQSSNSIYTTAGGSPGPVPLWTNDADTPLVPERLVRLGLRWMWKESKGLSYAEAMTTYERTLESLASMDWGLAPLETSNGEFGDDTEFGEPRVQT
jgi:hypothetical protein